MNYKKYEMGNYNLYFVKTTKFKTVSVSINLKRENNREDEVYRSILRRVLQYATNDYHGLDELCRASMELYDPSISIGTRSSGMESVIFLESSYANEKYTEKGMHEKTLNFIFSHLWNPYVSKGAFNEDVFEICRHEYIQSLKSIKDNPDGYSRQRIWEELGIQTFKEFTTDECISFASSLTNKDLYDYYKSLFEECSLDIFIAGDVPMEETLNIIDGLVSGDFKKAYETRFINPLFDGKVKEVTEDSSNSQSKLVLALKMTNLTDYELKYVSLAYNNILGGGWNSKLNKVVREENSLCYYIYASRQMTYGVSFIHSGIDVSNYEKCVSLIKKQMEKIACGDISDDELRVVKDTYINALTNIDDNQDAILGNVISSVFIGTDDISVRKEKMESVTVSDIKKVASKINIDTIYLLKGGEKCD